jgi:mannose-1-phosphate guanylyltransferase/mannose-1-phosphate guanylyltransferase/mannose-6-phosphate isomerase
MSSARVTPIILAGGAGARLWPVSRDGLPKQFQPLVGPLSTYQQTLERVADSSLFDAPFVITHESFRFFAKRQAEAVQRPATIVLEPARRDSAAAVAVAALIAEREQPGSLVMTLAADHMVLDDDEFRSAVRVGIEAASAGRIVVFGIRPTEPRTGFGYIRPGEPLGDDEDLRDVTAFVEKPNFETALVYLRDGYLWNSGNFLFRSDIMIREFARHAPDILASARDAVTAARMDIGFLRLDETAFAGARATSIDYAVIEKSQEMAVVAGHFRWSDIGSWDAVRDVLPHDEEDNAVFGRGLFADSHNCLVHSEGLLTTLVGVDDLVVVATTDAVMVARRDRLGELKPLVERMKAEGLGEATQHRRDHRPWGYVEGVDAGARFAVKRLVVETGGMLSLQRHMHRAEHWIVVKGTATVTIGDKVSILSENQSVYVPVGAPHRLANAGRIPLELVEIRTGGYLGEDDIERIDDLYDRHRTTPKPPTLRIA